MVLEKFEESVTVLVSNQLEQSGREHTESIDMV